MIESVAVLGTGIMGAPMAVNLAKAGLKVRAWNRSPGKARALGVHGIAVVNSAAEAARDVDVVVTMLADGPAVETVMRGGAVQAMPTGALWLQMSTIGVEWNAEVHALATTVGVDFVDAPVLGTRQPAEDGALVVLASGADDLIARAATIFDAIASTTIDAGPVGAGQRLKLVVNNWVLGMVGILAESIAAAEALELDPQNFLDAIASTAVDAGYAHIKGKAMIDGNHSPNGPLRHARKDAALIREAVNDRGLTLPIAEAVGLLLKTAESAGHGDFDMSAIHKTLGTD